MTESLGGSGNEGDLVYTQDSLVPRPRLTFHCLQYGKALELYIRKIASFSGPTQLFVAGNKGELYIQLQQYLSSLGQCFVMNIITITTLAHPPHSAKGHMLREVTSDITGYDRGHELTMLPWQLD